jgi:hypothetical protein
MNRIRIVLAVLGAMLLLLGLIFLIAASEGNAAVRILSGCIMLCVGLFLFMRSLKRDSATNVVISQKLELSGNVSLENLKCESCGAGLSPDNVAVRAGAVFASCPYCRAEYQLEEEPKW